MASQVNHFKEFATQADYEAYIQPDDYAKPLVALVEATGTVMFPQGGGGGGGGNPILTSVDVADFTGTNFDVGYKYITEAVIPTNVTTLLPNAFKNFSGLRNVTLHSGIGNFGDSVFYGCTSLTSMDLSGLSISVLSGSMFSGCTSLASVQLPSTLTGQQGDNVFKNCTSLTSIDMSGTTITKIYTSRSQDTYGTFNGCTSLTTVKLPSTVTVISNYSFYNCSSLTSLTIEATTPPTMPANALSGTNANLVIYVPSASVETYKTASIWSDFATHIQAIPSA